MSCSVTDPNSVAGVYSAVVGSSLLVQCNVGYSGGGMATCLAGSGPVVFTTFPQCTGK